MKFLLHHKRINIIVSTYGFFVKGRITLYKYVSILPKYILISLLLYCICFLYFLIGKLQLHFFV